MSSASRKARPARFTQVRIGAELFMRRWTVSIGVYPADAACFYYGAVAEGEGPTLSEALADAREQWRDIKEEQRIMKQG